MRYLILTSALVVALPALAAAEPSSATQPASPALAESAAKAEPTTAEAAPAAASDAVAEARAEGKAAAEVASAPEPEPTLSPVSSNAVARASFATAIDHREPVDSIESLGSDHDRVFYFTEFVGVSGRELTHRWEFDGQVVAEVPISVGGPRWRAYSSKSLMGGRLGQWTVSVVDETGHVVHTDSFVYEEAAPEPEVAMPEATTTEVAPPAAPAPAPEPESTPDESPATGATTQP